MVPLSDIVRVAADRAIRNAAAAGRSTVLERDVEASEDPSQSSER
jgi:histone H3/H4